MIFHGFGVSPLAGRPKDCRQRGAPQFGHYFFTSGTKQVFHQNCQRGELLIASGKIKHSLKRHATAAPICPWLWTLVTRPEGSKCGTEAEKSVTLQVWNRQKRCKIGGPPRTDGRTETSQRRASPAPRREFSSRGGAACRAPPLQYLSDMEKCGH